MIDWTIANVLSLASFTVSIYVLWNEKLRAFKLKVGTTGRVAIARNPWSVDLCQDGLYVDLFFRNLGARTGFVNSVALVATIGRKSQALIPHTESTDRTLQLKQVLESPSLLPFSGFAISRGDAIAKRIFFVPYQNTTNFLLPTGECAVEVLIRTNQSTNWQHLTKFAITIDQADVDALVLTTAERRPDGNLFVTYHTREKMTKEDEEFLKELDAKVSAKGKL